MHIFLLDSRQTASNSFNVWGSQYKIIGTNRAEKCAYNLHSCISAMDKVKINEQNKSIATGPLYLHSEFEAIWTFLPKDMVVLNPMRYHIS